jgi:hypothetical protein
MTLKALVCVLMLVQGAVPFKPNEEFEVKFNFEFKERQRDNANKVLLDATRKEVERSRGSGPLPYLFLNFRVLKQDNGEERIRVFENGRRTIQAKKFDTNTVLKLDLGFTDDIKDRIGPYEYEIVLLSDKKDAVSRVVIFFEEDGTYLVNGEVRGKI